MPPQGQGYGPGAQQMYPPGGININIVNPVYGNPAPQKNNTPLIVEILLSIFLGIYGVGWLMAGETTVGIILLICSFFVYLPVLILGTILTVGFGIICIGPLAIGAIILNAVMLNNVLKRKATQYIYMQPK